MYTSKSVPRPMPKYLAIMVKLFGFRMKKTITPVLKKINIRLNLIFKNHRSIVVAKMANNKILLIF
jgi:hypothetical protein